MKITLIQNIRVNNIPVLDTSDGEVGTESFTISLDEPITIDIPSPPQNRYYPFTLQTLPIYVRQQVRQRLRERIFQKFREVMNKDIRKLVGEVEGSPPVIIYTSVPLTKDEYELYVKEHTDATFQVILTDNQNISSTLWGTERLWRIDAPSWINHNANLYHQPNKDSNETCAYEYLISKFGKRIGFKKIAKDKTSIDNVLYGRYKKAELHKKIYAEWLVQYQDKLGFENLIPQEIHPLPDVVEVGDLDDEMYKIEELDITKHGYNWREEEETLSILDLVRWCIAGNVRLNVYDYDNADYLSYNPNDFRNIYTDLSRQRKKYSIAVKVAHKHAYFIEDVNLKIGLSVSKSRHKLSLCDVGWRKDREEGGDKGDLESVYHVNSEETYHKFAPPSPSKLVEWMKDKTKLHHYYIGVPNVNGLVSYLYRKGMNPDKLTGSAHSIHTATFGSLKVYCFTHRPKRKAIYFYKKLYELYPDLKSKKGVIPTDTRVAEGVYESLKLTDHNSMMNSQTKRIFFDSEIKPDNRKEKVLSTGVDIMRGFDLNKAYTTALLNNEYDWNVYDSVSQFKKYNDKFNPNYFYLCYNKENSYPCIKGKGLLLYHGSLLRYVLDKVEIKYFIKPIEKDHKPILSKDHFVSFVDACKELEEATESNIFTYKTLVNRFIGNCKKKSGIQQYGLYLHQDKRAVQRIFVKNYIPSRLKGSGLTWRNEPILTSKPQLVNHFENAQPIRLQILSMCNEMNYKVYLHYRKCLYVYRFINNYQNDLKQRKILSKIRGKKGCVSKIKNYINWTPIMEGVNTDSVKFRELENYKPYSQTPSQLRGDRFANYVVESFNDSHNFTIKQEPPTDRYDYDIKFGEQLGVKYTPNLWETDITVNHKWDKDVGGKLLMGLGQGSGGCWYSGLGGRGKSELVKGFRERCDKNSIEYKSVKKWIRFVSKLCGYNHYDLEQSYLDNNITTYELFAPTNKSANVIGGKTLHKGLGICVQDEEDSDEEDLTEEPEPKPYLDSIIKRFEGDMKNGVHPLGAIVVDELSMVNGYMLSILAYIKTRIPTIKFFLFGDIEHQLPPVKEENRNFLGAYVIKELTNFTKINLNYNFRMGVSGDKLWENSAEPHQRPFDIKPLTDRNLCYTNKKRKEIINERQELINNPIIIDYVSKKKIDEYDERQTLKYSHGTPMIARKGMKDLGVAKNEMYIVVQLEPLQLYNPINLNLIELTNELLIANFLSGLCITIHKAQGETYDDEYTIHEWNKLSKPDYNGMNRKLRYTAESRSSDPESNISYRL